MSGSGYRRAEAEIGRLLRDTLKSLFFYSLFLLSHSDTLFPVLMDCLALYSIFLLPCSIFLLMSPHYFLLVSPDYFHINPPSGYLMALFWLSSHFICCPTDSLPHNLHSYRGLCLALQPRRVKFVVFRQTGQFPSAELVGMAGPMMNVCDQC